MTVITNNTPETTPLPAPSDFYDAAHYSPQTSLGFLMRRVLGSILQQADAQLHEHGGLTYVQWLPLYHLLLSNDNTCTGASLARGLGMDPASVTRAVDRLEAKGLVVRERSTEDRRVVHLALTGEGRQLATRVPEVLVRVLNQHLAGFSHAECALMLSFVQRMVANGDAMRGGACPNAIHLAAGD